MADRQNAQQMIALAEHCRLAGETSKPQFRWSLPVGVSVVLIVNSGYELIEMGLGGPVWHASCASTGPPWGRLTLERYARQALAGVGDPSAGEWIERGPKAVHVRRRLNVTEAAMVGPVVDVRGTDEAVRRWRAAGLPANMEPR